MVNKKNKKNETFINNFLEYIEIILFYFNSKTQKK